MKGNRKQRIEANVRAYEKDLWVVNELLQTYFLDPSQLNSKLEGLNKCSYKIGSKYQRYLSKLPIYLLHLCCKYRCEIKDSVLDQILYEIRSRIKSKMKRAVLAAQTEPLKVEKKTSYEVVCENFKLLKGRIVLNYGTVGRNGRSNYQVYRSNVTKMRYYYHSHVRGGGLVALKAQLDEVGAALALIFSKNLKTKGTAQGLVVRSSKIRAVNKEGTFRFENSQILLGSPKDLVLRVRRKDRTVLLALFGRSDLERLPKSYYFRYEVVENSRYKDLEPMISHGQLSKNLLDKLVPPLFDLRRFEL